MRIEDGKFYRRRDGVVVGPAKDTKDGSGYPVFVRRNPDGGGNWYTAEGRYWTSQTEDPCDLVEEVPDPNAKPALQVEEGNFYRRRDGVVVGPARSSGLDDDSPYKWTVGGLTYTDDGVWWLDSPDEPNDLLEEVPAPAAEPATLDEVARLCRGPIPAPEPKQESPRFRVGDRVRDVKYQDHPIATVFAVRGHEVKLDWDGDEHDPETNDFWPETDFELIDVAGVTAPDGQVDAKPDPVDHPSHYTTGDIECFDAMAAMLSREEMIGYLRGNSFKYRWRFRHKGGAEDLRKAAWYEDKLLGLVAQTEV